MSPIEILYDAVNNLIVIRDMNDKANPLGTCSAELAQRGQLPDAKAAKVGISRFVSFADWQASVAGFRVTTMTVEQLMNDLSKRL